MNHWQFNKTSTLASNLGFVETCVCQQSGKLLDTQTMKMVIGPRMSADILTEKLFLAAIKEVITDQVNAGIDVPTDGEVRRESYVLYQCRFL